MMRCLFLFTPAVGLLLLLAAPRPVADSRAGPDGLEARGIAPGQEPSQSALAPLEQAYRANNTGVAQLEQFDYSTAERSFREALRLRPELAMARLNLAIALLYAGQLAEAAVEAKNAVTLMPASPRAHFVLGLAAKADNRLEEAAAAFRRVLDLDPQDAGARIHLGQIHLQQRQFDDALRLLQEALSAEPYNVTAAYNVALALTRAGQAEEGRRAMQRFEALRDSAYGVTYAQSYLGQGRYGEALASTGAEADLVDPAPPGVTYSDATSALLETGSAGTPADRIGSVTLFDAEGDGDLDLIATGAGAPRLFRNEGGKLITDGARLSAGRLENSTRALSGDYDNDGRPDLLFLREDGHALLRQDANGSFEDVTARALPAGPSPASVAAFADVDHDGDLDLLLAGHSLQLLRNNGDGTFSDITESSRAGVPLGRAVGIAAVDFDNRRDVDILVAGTDHRPVLLRNLRDGSFRPSDSDAGLPAAGTYSALAIGDVNKDGYTDVLYAKAEAPGVLALSDGRGAFRTDAAPEASRGAVSAQFVDYDNDGLLDLLTLSPARAHLFRNTGGDRWIDVTEDARLHLLTPGDAAFQAVGVGDLDGDGDRDIVVRLSNGELRIWRNEASGARRSIAVRLTSRVSNRSAFGARVEVRAGSLHQMLDSVSSTPAIAPADLIFGLGAREADVVRVLWPSGILQAETSPAAPAAGSGRTVEITELDRKPSSCPYLFTWNGSRFEFVTDFMGGGEMGAWLAPSIWNDPDPDEYVRISGSQLRPRAGRYELRLTNELEEAVFLDRAQLVAIDHPADVDVYPNEGLRSPPRPSFRLIGVRDASPPVHAVDGDGNDVLPRITSLDRRYADTFRELPVRGYAESHDLVLDLGALATAPVLLMTGWTDYAFSTDNVAASQAGLTMHPPSLQVRDADGVWRTAIEEIGFPVGRPQTVVVDLSGKFLSASREVRIVSNMRIYWDQILVGEHAATARLAVTRLDPLSAELQWRGFSEEASHDGREPYGYDYHRVSSLSPWKVMIGRYTREGDVRPLLRSVDDLFVISRPGDEVALSFRALPPVAAHQKRTFLLYAHGYSKEMNPRSASPDTVAPLPFRSMSGYPYAADEHYPRTTRHRRYLEQYNTRVVSRAVPSIDAISHQLAEANDPGRAASDARRAAPEAPR